MNDAELTGFSPRSNEGKQGIIREVTAKNARNAKENSDNSDIKLMCIFSLRSAFFAAKFLRFSGCRLCGIHQKKGA
jgi:hypothetical protein